MSTVDEDGNAQLRELVEQYREQYEELGRTQEKLRAVSCTAVAPRQVVSVTVGHGGSITDVSFPSSAYKRMAPGDLGKAVMETVGKAQALAADEVTAILAPTMPAGMDARSLVDGTADLRSLLPAEPDGENLHVNVLDELLGRRG